MKVIVLIAAFLALAHGLNIDSLRSSVSAQEREAFYARAAVEGLHAYDLHTVEPSANLYHPSVRYIGEQIESYQPSSLVSAKEAAIARGWAVKTTTSYSAAITVGGPIEPSGIVILEGNAKISTEVAQSEKEVLVTYSIELGAKVKVDIVKIITVSVSVAGTFASTCSFKKAVYSTNMENSPMASTLYCLALGLKQLISTKQPEAPTAEYVKANMERLKAEFTKWKDTPTLPAVGKANPEKYAIGLANVMGYKFYHGICTEARFAKGIFKDVEALITATNAKPTNKTADNMKTWDAYVDAVEGMFRVITLGSAQSTPRKDLACADVTDFVGRNICMFYKAGMMLPTVDKQQHFWSANHGSKENFRNMIVRTFQSVIPSEPHKEELTLKFNKRITERLDNFRDNWVCDKAKMDVEEVSKHVAEMARVSHWDFEEAITITFQTNEYEEFMKKLAAVPAQDVEVSKASFTFKFAFSVSSTAVPSLAAISLDITPANKKWEWTSKDGSKWLANTWKYSFSLTSALVGASIALETESASWKTWKKLLITVDFTLPEGFDDEFFKETSGGLAKVETPLNEYAGSLLTLLCSIKEKGWKGASFKEFGKSLLDNGAQSSPKLLKMWIEVMKAALAQDKVDKNADWRASLPAKIAAMAADVAARAAVDAIVDSIIALSPAAYKPPKSTFGIAISFSPKVKGGTGCFNNWGIESVAFARKKTTSLKFSAGGASLKVDGTFGAATSMSNDGKF